MDPAILVVRCGKMMRIVITMIVMIELRMRMMIIIDDDDGEEDLS